MAISGGLAGLAGVLFTFTLGAITPESGDTLLVKAFACIILGGVGSMAGVAFGSFFLAAAEVCGAHPDERARGSTPSRSA